MKPRTAEEWLDRLHKAGEDPLQVIRDAMQQARREIRDGIRALDIPKEAYVAVRDFIDARDKHPDLAELVLRAENNMEPPGEDPPPQAAISQPEWDAIVAAGRAEKEATK